MGGGLFAMSKSGFDSEYAPASQRGASIVVLTD
jgi:hypothetical protein